MVGAWGAAWQEHSFMLQSLAYSHAPIVIIRDWFLWLYPKIRSHGFQNPYSKARLWNISAMLKPAAKPLWLPITATLEIRPYEPLPNSELDPLDQLRNSVISYIEPTEPVDQGHWEALQ